MNCVTVRDTLAERALGAVSVRDRSHVERHLVWCAACRKEAGELESAAAVFGFAVAPTHPEPTLEDRVVTAVQEAAEGRTTAHVAPRRGRLAIVAVLASMLAVSGLGWGAVMAGRAARSDEAARVSVNMQQSAQEEFARILASAEFSDPEGEVLLGTLRPTTENGGAGSALTLVSPSILDMAVVLVNGVPPAQRKDAPFVVWLRGRGAAEMQVGAIATLDDAGSGIVWDDVEQDLGVFDKVIVRDASGRVVMRGAIATRAPLSSPSP